jgi:outer membrane receptor protein involved in Fe transport
MVSNRKTLNAPRLVLTALALAVAPVSQTMAQLMLEEVVVTAQKREQSLQDVPIAVAAMSGEKVNDTGIVNLEELTLYIPNVNINQGAQSPNMYIRGVGSGTNAGFEQSVGMYIDGIYSGRAQLASVPLTLDLARVEVLKGPQGILFGKNTIGGAINITTARPDYEFESYVEALYAPDDGEQLYTGVVNGGITDSLAGRLAVRYEGMDGWWDNKTLDTEGPDKDNLYIRGSLLWDASDTVEVLAKYEHGDFDTASQPTVVYQSDQPINFLGEDVVPIVSDRDDGIVDFASLDETETDVFALTVNWDLDFAMFTSITGYAGYETERDRDSDYTATAAIPRHLSEKYDQFSQEVRLVSPGGETLDWIVGAYYQDSELDLSTSFPALDIALVGDVSPTVPLLVGLGESIPSIFDQESSSWAIFAQGTWNVADTVRLGLGIRYNEEEKDLDKINDSRGLLGARAASSGPSANLIVQARPADNALIGDLRSHSFTDLSREEDAVTWSTNIQWDATDQAMLYVSASTGFKGGGFDASYGGAGPAVRTGNIFTGEPDGGVIETGIDSSILEYDEETVIAYELGAKMTLAEGAATLNIAIFRMEYEDLQVSSLVGDVFEVSNAGEAISQGVELDGRWLLAEGFTLGGSVAFLDASYDKFDSATCTIPQVSDPANNPGCLRDDGSNVAVGELGSQDLSGETLLFAPEWSYNINAEWIIPLTGNMELRTNADVNYTDEFYSALDLDPSTRHDSAVKVNARIALASVDDTWSVALIGKNLTDEETRVWHNDVPTSDSNSYFGIPERPRSLAIQARYRF